jgi:hypothetical protein
LASGAASAPVIAPTVTPATGIERPTNA